MYKYYYALEKLNRAIYIMAVGPGDVRARMRSAFEYPLVTLTSNKLPKNARGLWKEAHKIATRYDERYSGEREALNGYSGACENLRPGLYEATFRRINRSTGQKVAELIYQIWDIVVTDHSETT